VLRGSETFIGREVTNREWAITHMPAHHASHKLPEVARVAWRSPMVIETEGVSDFCVGASRCIGAACLGSGTA
jgi:hypothetical protein